MENKPQEKDWELVITSAERAIRDARLGIVINEAVLKCARKAIIGAK